MPAIGFEAQAPGKLILMGEHAAVYGRPALVAAIGLRTKACVEPVQTDGLALDLPDLPLREKCSWQEVVAYGDRRRERWRRWCAERDSGRTTPFPGLGAQPESGLIKIAVAEALRALQKHGEPSRYPGLVLSLTSEVPRGAGFGSSASVAVAVGAAILACLGDASPEGAFGERERERVAAVALEVEKRQHGRPSGVDHTAVLRGGFLAVAGGKEGLKIRELPRPEWLRPAIRVFDTGTPVESTGEVVEAVRRVRDLDPGRFTAILDEMEQATGAFRDCLGEREPPWQAMAEAMRSFHGCLETLGVVPAPVAQAVRRVEAAGGAAKISGAGSLSGTSAGSLVVLWPPESAVECDLGALLEGYRPLDARLGARGLDLRRSVHA